MSAKKSLGFITVTTGLVLSASAYSAEVKINAEVDIGAEYHFQLLNTDDGLKKEGSEVKETDFLTKAAKLSIRGKITDQLSWNLLYQADKNVLERYWLTNKITDDLEVSIGQQKIKTYGWHRKLTSSSTSPARSSMITIFNPLTDKLAIDVVYKMFGTWSLTAVKDYYDNGCPNNGSQSTPATAATCKSWNGYDVQKQPALVLEYVGKFGEWQPLVQYSRYDRNHSSSVSAGLRFKNDFVDAYVDWTLDERNYRGFNAAGKPEDHENKIQGAVVYGEFFTGTWTPYAMYSSVNVDPFTAPGGKEVKTNSDDGKAIDNEQLIAGGVFYDGYGKYYRPYLGILSTSGRYNDPKVATDEETRTRFDIQLGLTGKF